MYKDIEAYVFGFSTSLKIIHDQTYRKFEADLTVGLLTPPASLTKKKIGTRNTKLGSIVTTYMYM